MFFGGQDMQWRAQPWLPERPMFERLPAFKEMRDITGVWSNSAFALNGQFVCVIKLLHLINVEAPFIAKASHWHPALSWGIMAADRQELRSHANSTMNFPRTRTPIPMLHAFGAGFWLHHKGCGQTIGGC